MLFVLLIVVKYKHMKKIMELLRKMGHDFIAYIHGHFDMGTKDRGSAWY
jgi:hypothetical protein